MRFLVRFCWPLCLLSTVVPAFRPPFLLRTQTRDPSGRIGSVSSLHGTPVKGEEDEFTVAVLGDLHLDPRYMEDHIEGRQQLQGILCASPSPCVVSLGDLGESKSVDQTEQIFSGTSASFRLASAYLNSYGYPFEVITGNHDLEGMDEFSTDGANLEAFCNILGKPKPYFKREVANKTLLIGLATTAFRDAVYSSHEVYVDDEQLRWFEETLKSCPASDGWRVFVFSHAPPTGSGLRVVQALHVVNGCCWLNHSKSNAGRFIELVKEHRCIKAWFSGHFHLGQDYQDSITFPDGDRRGSCVFAQTGVMGSRSSRDKRRQSRLIRGNRKGFTISTIDHGEPGRRGGGKGTEEATERLDVTVSFEDSSTESVIFAHPPEQMQDTEGWMQVYKPMEDDGCYVDDIYSPENLCNAGQDGAVCWWHMACGRVLGVHNGIVLEYDSTTLAPLGLVVSEDELRGKQLAIVNVTRFDKKETLEETAESLERTQEVRSSSVCEQEQEQAVVLYDEKCNALVVQPNEDGSYWRKLVRNKVIRMREKRRERAAAEFLAGLREEAHRTGLAEPCQFHVKSLRGPK
uniref:Uncharacterized protein n=1 Tax=Chromera velia CCMP2878 TaxID=1169474 RepID=A0A0G4H8L3_9ALVE|eukprot:Cvel_5898.t1-p1 / transcript=Cvel_5898.t1 / gene=Cvel_5898 / organism=Chromera_velia_CCMP2878 / gene_product=hypothetical protein / transcript_product=hypothetical protein / location=Cvel_scaffold281:55888-58628(+) / protein_length=572 / sequence_SO=supercontig / SO=protein_coding / is_pseudo=false